MISLSGFLSFAKSHPATFSHEQLGYKSPRLQSFSVTTLCKLFHCLLTFDFAKNGETSLIFATIEISFYSSFDFLNLPLKFEIR